MDWFFYSLAIIDIISINIKTRKFYIALHVNYFVYIHLIIYLFNSNHMNEIIT